MHKVINRGSALQAYALQNILEKLGFDSTIIDYEFPYNVKPWWRKILSYMHIKYQIIKNPKCEIALYHRFYEKYFKLTRNKYTRSNISINPPQFDIYLTGSDQVWNAEHTHGDINFMLSFAPKGYPRIAYAASFARICVPLEFHQIYANELKKYDRILVREQSGISIVKRLTGADAEVVCDPTLLLTASDYDRLAEDSEFHYNKHFILVYLLDYMFNPYPDVDNIVETVKQTLGYDVLYLTCKNPDCMDPTRISISNIGPCEFVWLFKHAGFVVTSSFHGTAFSVIYNRPLLSIVKDKKGTDGRILTLLESVGQSRSIVVYNEQITPELVKSHNILSNYNKVVEYRFRSTKLLCDMLEDVKVKYKLQNEHD